MAEIPTPTVVRIKRRIGTESSESIIVSAKRKKISDDENQSNPIDDVCKTILKKLTTLKNGDSLEIEAKRALDKAPRHSWELKETFKKGMNSTPKDLVQKKSKSDVTAIRFKLICAKRNIEEKDENESDFEFNFFDALKESEQLLPMQASSSEKPTSSDVDVITCNGVPMKSEKIEYVYDLYYTSFPLEFSNWIDNICEIQKTNALEYHPESDTDGDGDADEDDENSESNWRNDYPEEDEGDFYEDEDDYLCAMMKKTRIKGDSDSSYDVDDYIESGDFDEDGQLMPTYNPRDVFRDIILSDDNDDDHD